MKSQRNTSIFKSAAWNKFAGVLTFLPFFTVTYAVSSLSLVPNPPKACEVLTIQWPVNEEAALVNLTVVEESGQTPATLFETTVDAPTQSVEWQVFAIEGISLQIAVFTGGDAGSPPYQATGVIVQSGACDPPVNSGLSVSESFPSSPSLSSPTRSLGSDSGSLRVSQTAPPQSLSPSMLTATATRSITPRTTSASLPGQSSLTASAAAGIATGVTASVVCLAVASFSYIKRCRSRAPTAHANPFRAPHGPPSLSSQAPSSDEARDTHQGGPEMYQHPDSSLVARASSMESCMLDRIPHLSHLCRESIDVLPMSDKLLRDRKNRIALAPPMDAAPPRADTAVEVAVGILGHGREHARAVQQETDGGVRLAGGRARESVVDDFDAYSTFRDGSIVTLPPPYSSHF